MTDSEWFTVSLKTPVPQASVWNKPPPPGVKWGVYALPTLPHTQGSDSRSREREKEKKEKVFLFSETFTFYHIHLQVKENEQEQRITVGYSKIGALLLVT